VKKNCYRDGMIIILVCKLKFKNSFVEESKNLDTDLKIILMVQTKSNLYLAKFLDSSANPFVLNYILKSEILFLVKNKFYYNFY